MIPNDWCWCVPHMRGDEPSNTQRLRPGHDTFLTCVGMNHLILTEQKSFFSVPHMRGDEPFNPC